MVHVTKADSEQLKSTVNEKIQRTPQRELESVLLQIQILRYFFQYNREKAYSIRNSIYDLVCLHLVVSDWGVLLTIKWSYNCHLIVPMQPEQVVLFFFVISIHSRRHKSYSLVNSYVSRLNEVLCSLILHTTGSF